MNSISYSNKKRPKVTHIKERLGKITRMDRIRLLRIGEMIQYTIIYAVLGFICAVAAEWIIPAFSATRHVGLQIINTLLQLSICVVAVFYIKKIGKTIPLLFPYPADYRPYETFEYSGGLALNIMFLMVQPNLRMRVAHLSEIIQGIHS
jgi:hypothetical protein